MFRSNTIDSAISGLVRAVDKLKKASNFHSTKADVHVQEVGYHRGMEEYHLQEVKRADKIADNISRIID